MIVQPLGNPYSPTSAGPAPVVPPPPPPPTNARIVAPLPASTTYSTAPAQPKPQQQNVWKQVATDLFKSSTSFLSSFLQPKQPAIISPLPEPVSIVPAKKPSTAVAALQPSFGEHVTAPSAQLAKPIPSIGQIQDKAIAGVQDYLAKNYDSTLTKTLAFVQQKVEEDFKKRPETFTFTREVTRIVAGGTKAFDEYYNRETFVPQDFFGKTRATTGEVVATLMAWHAGGQALKAVGAAKATLPVLFATFGQLTAPYGTTLQQRIEKLPKDLVTGWLFAKVPQSEKLLSLQTVKGALPAGFLTYASAVADKLIMGMTPRAAAETSLTAFLIGALFHTTNVAYNQFVSAKVFEKGQTMTPDQIRAQAQAANIPKETKQAFERLATAAEAQGKNVKIDVVAIKESPAAKIIGKKAVEEVTGRPQEIKLTNGEGTQVVVKVEYVEPSAKLPTGEAPKEQKLAIPTDLQPLAEEARKYKSAGDQGVSTKTPSLSISAGGTARPSASTAVTPSFVSETVKRSPYSSYTPATTTSDVLSDASFIDAYDYITSEQEYLGGLLKDIAGERETALGVKTKESAAQKIIRTVRKKPTFSVHNLEDLVRGSIFVNDDTDAKRVLTALQEKATVLQVRDHSLGKNSWGYRGINVWVRTPKGNLNEVQIHTSLSRGVDKAIRPIYEKWRNEKIIPPSVLEQSRQLAEQVVRDVEPARDDSKQAAWIIDTIYNSEDSPEEMKRYLMREGPVSEETADRAVKLRDWVAKQGHVVTYDELAAKLLEKKEVAPAETPEKKLPEGQKDRVKEIKEFFEVRYGKPIEKATMKEINELGIAGKPLPFNKESEPIYKKITSPVRGIERKSFEQKPNLLFGGIEHNIITDGYILITDKTVADKINQNLVDRWEKDYIKSIQRSAPPETMFVEIERLAKENTQRLIDQAKKEGNYPKQEMIDKIIPREWGPAVDPLGFSFTSQGPMVYFSDENYEIILNGDKIAFLQKHLPDATIHLSGDLKPVAFVRRGKVVAVLMPIRPQEGGFPKQFSRLTKKEEAKPEAPAYKGGAEGAAIGKFADLVNTTKEREERGDLPSMRYVPFPEVVRLVRSLTGKLPQVKKRKYAHGTAQAVTLDVELKASIFEDPEQAAKTLSHELGHIIDYLPEGERRTGNILGRIASLHDYFKHWLAEFPGGTGKMLTDKEKRQLRKEAEELAKKPVTEEREIVVEEKAPGPDEILDIWRTNTSSIDNPELLSYIQKLPDALKKDIVKAALQSTVPKWVTFKKQVKERITVGVIRSAPEDIRRLYQELLHKEILKRRLIELKTVRQELQALSQVWRPFDRIRSSDNYVKYRDRPGELYADAISVLFNDPVRLRETAPTFYKAFFNYLSQKPEVHEEYYQIQHLLNRGSDEVNKERIEEIYEGFEEGAKKRKENFEKKMQHKSFFYKATTQHISKFHPVYHTLNKAIREGKVQMSEKQAIRETLETMAYSRNDVWLDLEKNENDVLRPLAKVGVREREIGAWFMLERNLADRMGIANPGGLIGDFNKEVKAYLEKNFTEEQQTALRDGVKKFHETTFAIAQEMYNEGMIPEKVFKERIEPYKDSYVTYGVVKYLDKNYVTPYVREMTGTLEEIENPLVTTMYKRASMIQALLTHKARKQVVALLKQVSPEDIQLSKSVMGIKHQRIFRPAPGKGQIVLQENGKWVSYDVDPYFEQMFKQFDPKDFHTLAYLAGQFNKYFKPVVTTYKLGWAVYNNPARDVQRTMKNLAAISKIEGIPFDRIRFLRDWVKSIPEGFRFSGGSLTPLAREALGEHAISTPWVQYDPTAGEDKALYTLYQKYRVFGLENDPQQNKRITQKFLLPVELVLKALERTGGTFESTTKLAGFRYLSQRMEDQGKVGFYTRNYVGTPNYLEGGSMKEIDNNLWVFSNVVFQGYRSDIELIRNPRSRGAWFFESFLQSGIWKLLMVIAAGGLLGKSLEDAYDNMPEYFKSNYIAVPIGRSDSGKVLFWTIPQDETNRLIGSIIWKTGMALQGKLIKPQQVLDIGAGFAPSMTPLFSVIGAWFDYARGRNPWSSYYGRNVLDARTHQIRGAEGLKQMALWSLNEVGLGNFATYDPATRTTQEKFLQFTPLINRIFRVSDYGITEREVEDERKEEQRRAIQNKREDDLVKRYADVMKKEGGDADTYKDRIAEELYPEGPTTSEEKENLNRVKKAFDQEMLRRENDTRINTIMRLNLSASKVNAIKGFKEDMDQDAFEEMLNKLYEAKVISKDVYNEVIQ